MDVFRPIPIDVFQVNEKSVVDLFVRQEDRLVSFIEKGGILTKDHLADLNRYGVKKIFIRERERALLSEYVSSFSDRILTDPAVSSKIKAATFYISSVHAVKKAFDDPNEERIEEIKKTLKPMLVSIVKNEVLLSDLFSITEYDYSTYTHSVNVGIFATSLAVAYYKDDSSMRREDLERLSYGFFLHDIGKSKIPLSILRKRGKLSEDEWVVMKKHPEWGYSILMETSHLTDEAAYISMQHHERPDGSGYPSGMTDIHPCARICTIADIYEALTSDRPYKTSMKPFDALRLLKEEALTKFDLDLLKTLIRLLGPQANHIQISNQDK